jgi:hypothetical protein
MGCGCLVGGDFDGGGSGGGFVDDALLRGVGGDEGLNSDVVDGSGEASGDLVDEVDGVVGEQCVGSAGELDVVADVAGGLGWGEGRHRESESPSDAVAWCSSTSRSHTRRPVCRCLRGALRSSVNH